MKFKKSFTLAEVLITIGVIGIVSAMVMPNLVTSFAVRKHRVQLKKAVAVLNQAALQTQANFELDYASASTPCNPATGSTEKPSEVLSFCSLYNSVLNSRFVGPLDSLGNYAINVAAVSSIIGDIAYAEGGETLTISTDPGDYLAYQMADGIMVAFNKNAKNCTWVSSGKLNIDWIRENPNCVGFIDVNGPTTPNKIVNCDGINSAQIDMDSSCVVPLDMQHLTDIYPIIFHDTAVAPITPAARNVLVTSQSTMSTDSQIH